MGHGYNCVLKRDLYFYEMDITSPSPPPPSPSSSSSSTLLSSSS
jgi:hypothetical protein